MTSTRPPSFKSNAPNASDRVGAEPSESRDQRAHQTLGRRKLLIVEASSMSHDLARSIPCPPPTNELAPPSALARAWERLLSSHCVSVKCSRSETVLEAATNTCTPPSMPAVPAVATLQADRSTASRSEWQTIHSVPEGAMLCASMPRNRGHLARLSSSVERHTVHSAGAREATAQYSIAFMLVST